MEDDTQIGKTSDRFVEYFPIIMVGIGTVATLVWIVFLGWEAAKFLYDLL